MEVETTPLQRVGTIKVDTVNKTEQKHAFFLLSPNTNTYIMRNGNKVLFKMGAVPAFPNKPAFVTDIAGYVAELNEQIAFGHPELHTEKDYETVTEEQLDPLDAVKKKAVEDFMQSEEFKKALLNFKGVGTPVDSETVQPAKLSGVATTANIAAAAGESTSPAQVAASGPVTLGSLSK